MYDTSFPIEFSRTIMFSYVQKEMGVSWTLGRSKLETHERPVMHILYI
jgi:hypothetical protein